MVNQTNLHWIQCKDDAFDSKFQLNTWENIISNLKVDMSFTSW
jgi:hypothetical protein